MVSNMAVWELVKDLNVEINDQTVQKILSKMTAEDWSAIKADLEELTANNKKLAKTISMVDMIIDLVVARGISVLI